ncbi:MAG: class I SAM-dependent methyltransferase [Anaerolineaceae bacterium]|nr:class I SAM-dependent methyltransferase [Anaerolineaceae bacterium]
MPIIDHFNIIAPIYNKLFGSSSNIVQWQQLLKLPANGILLDAGGGTGRVSKHLESHIDQIILMDESKGMLQQVYSKTRLQPICSEIEAIPLHSQSIDRIIVVDAFHHLKNQEVALREIWRILKHDGILLIEEPDIRQFGVKVLALIEKLLLMRSHFVPPGYFQKYFSNYSATIEIQEKGSTVWVAIQKCKNVKE